uniref:Uncharacterized protein n=1 Tax=Caenorhabditis japonica TaxID=281687 RepID=A0A8R1DPS5_CAEJA
MVGGDGGGGHGHSHGGGSSQGASHPSQAGFGPSTTTTSGRPLLRSMREAQLHSAAQPISAPSQYPTSANPLDPGSRPGQPSRRTSKVSGTGANSLLKQAIANRLMPHAAEGESSSQATSPSTEPAKIHKTDSSEMSKSVLMNPAWYRDNEGRTGYKTQEWEKMKNKQKNVVKENKKPRGNSAAEAGDVIQELDNDLLSETSSAGKSGSDNKSIDSVLSDPKAEKKAAKALEKEMKKREKEQKKLEKAQKKKAAEEEKKLKKKKGNKNSTEGSEIGEHESVEMKTIEKNKEKAEATITLTLGSKEKKEKEREKEKPKKVEKPSEKSSEGKSKKSTDSEKSFKEKSNDNDKGDDRADDKNDEKEPRNANRPPTNTSASHLSVRKLKSQHSKHSGQREPAKKNIGERRDSSMSELSRGSFKSVTFNDRVQTHEIERNSSVYTSSEDDAAIMSDDEMSKPERGKKKLVAQFQNQPEDIYDDEDLDDFEEQERLALLAAQGYDVRRVIQYGGRNGEESEDESEEEEEEEDGEEGAEEEEEEDTISQNNYYAEDVEGADIYLRNEHSFLGTDVNKERQIPNIGGRGGYEMFDRTMMGSMSKLHGEDSSSNSLLYGYNYNLPRSASGYFEPDGRMNFSYEEAVLNRQHFQQQQLLQQLEKLPLQSPQPEREVPAVHKLSSPSGGFLRQTATQRSIYENMSTGNIPSQPQSLIIPGSPSQRSQMARHEFFTQTTPNVLSKTVAAASSDQMSLGSTDSNATVKEEDEMRKRFVARFGARKAPIAREEDPADPHHLMGSQESVASTDSRDTSDPIGKPISERYNFNEMDRNLSALVKPLWAGTEKEDRAEKDDSTSS